MIETIETTTLEVKLNDLPGLSLEAAIMILLPYEEVKKERAAPQNVGVMCYRGATSSYLIKNILLDFVTFVSFVRFLKICNATVTFLILNTYSFLFIFEKFCSIFFLKEGSTNFMRSQLHKSWPCRCSNTSWVDTFFRVATSVEGDEGLNSQAGGSWQARSLLQAGFLGEQTEMEINQQEFARDPCRRHKEQRKQDWVEDGGQ